MPAEFIIDEGRAVVVSRGTGAFAHRDFVAHMALLLADPRFRPDFNQLVDCRAITALEFTAEQVRELASRSVFSPRSRRAFVVVSDLHFGLSRMFAAYRESGGAPGIMTFREMPPALAWLGLPPDFDPFGASGSKSDGSKPG